jgi:hypothetical protein
MRGGADSMLNGRIQAMETAFRMQTAATDAFDINRESTATREMYGKGHFANGCLLARRLCERGVRFVQLYYGNGQPWDTHSGHDQKDAATRRGYRPAHCCALLDGSKTARATWRTR